MTKRDLTIPPPAESLISSTGGASDGGANPNGGGANPNGGDASPNGGDDASDVPTALPLA